MEYERLIAQEEPLFPREDFWKDDGKGGKEAQLIEALGPQTEDKFNRWLLIATRDANDKPGLRVEFPDAGVRMKVPFVQEEL